MQIEPVIMPQMFRRSLPMASRGATAAFILFTGVAVTAAPARAAVSLSVGLTCVAPAQYDEMQAWEIPLKVSGLPQGAQPVASLADQSPQRLPATSSFADLDATGSTTGTLAAPAKQTYYGNPMKGLQDQVQLKDASGTVLASADVLLGSISLKLNGGKRVRSATKPITWEMSGYAHAGSTYYAHYFESTKTSAQTTAKPFKTYKLGITTNASGYLSVTRPLIPFKTSKQYSITIDTNKRFVPVDLYGSIPAKLSDINRSGY